MERLYDKIASYPSLLNGFYRVRENDGAPGFDHVTIDDFEDNIGENISIIFKQLRNMTYRQKPFLMFETKKQNGKIRLLSIPCVRDRVVQQSAMNVLEPVIEAELESETYAYRKGFSREAAAKRIIALYNKGFCWLADADIQDFFNNIDHSILISRVKEILPDPDALELIIKFIKPVYYFKNKKYTQNKGLPLGSAVSPMLANLYLDKFDEEIKKRGMQLVRFADDFVILTKTKPAAAEAIKISETLLENLKLKLNLKKTKVSSFKEGFKYLGYIFLNSLVVPASPKDNTLIRTSLFNDFLDENALRKIAAKKEQIKKLEIGLNSSVVGTAFLKALEEKGISLSQFIDEQTGSSQNKDSRTEKPVITDIESENDFPDIDSHADIQKTKEVPTAVSVGEFKRTLYLHEQGCTLSKEGGRFFVAKNETALLEVPIIRIAHIIVFGNCLITPAVYQTCLINHIPIALLSSRGRYYGTIDSYANRNTELEKIQFLRSLDDSFALSFAVKQVKVKIHNSRVLLQRHNKRIKSSEINSVLDQTKKILQSIDSVSSIDQLRGIEGSAASDYFQNFGTLFNADTGFFTNKFVRVRRPPTDPVNSLLSFGYTLLGFNIFSFIDTYGLNPYIGFYHVDRQGHPTLVSDVIEEFRHIIDSLVLYVINRKIIKKNDFYFLKEPSTPCMLNKRGRAEYIRQFEIKMHQVTTHTPSGAKVNYRKCLQLQAIQLANYLKGNLPAYYPMKIKL